MGAQPKGDGKAASGTLAHQQVHRCIDHLIGVYTNKARVIVGTNPVGARLTGHTFPHNLVTRLVQRSPPPYVGWSKDCYTASREGNREMSCSSIIADQQVRLTHQSRESAQ